MSEPLAIYVQLTPEAEALVRSLPSLPQRTLDALGRAMDKENQLTVAHIQRDYLSFPKSQKPVPLGLRVQSNRLRASVRASKAVAVGQEITSGIGSNVGYAALHEFGATFTRTSKPGKVRLRTDRKGNLLRNARNGAVFAQRLHTRAREVSYAGGRTYSVTVPERAPVRRGIADRLADYSASLSIAIEQTLNAA